MTRFEWLTPSVGIVLVLCDGQIVGLTGLMTALHADTVWIHPDHRGKVGVWRQLREGIASAAREHFSASGVLVTVTHRVIRKFMERVGVQMPGETYAWALKQQP